MSKTKMKQEEKKILELVRLASKIVVLEDIKLLKKLGER